MSADTRALRRAAVGGAVLVTAAALGGCGGGGAKTLVSAQVAPPDCRHVKCVALTFDDGPGKHTDQLLGILARRHAPATFFMIGKQVERFPEAAQRAAGLGFELGDHTWNHANLIGLSAEQVQSEITRTSDAILDATGARPDVMRPPDGAVDTVVARLVGLPVILWSVDTLDWRHRDPGDVLDAVRTGVRPGSIVIMHDIYKSTVTAVPRVIDMLRAQGYQLVTVRELYGGTLTDGKVYRGRQKAYANAHATTAVAARGTAPEARGRD